eukprot:3081450-Pyramimonas_sp.AAC.1
MIETKSISRVSRAILARATESGEGRFNLGDPVEIHRPPNTKDESSWAGRGTFMSHVCRPGSRLDGGQ